MTLSLVYRAARPSALTSSASRVPLTSLSTTRHASISSIIRGVVRSEQAREGRPDRVNKPEEKRMTYAERQKAREELAKARPDFKIRRGKKDITDYPDEAKPQSRRARFFDPESPFGKKSLVYQAKAGAFRDKLQELKGSTSSPFETSQPRSDISSRPRRSTRSSGDSAQDGASHADIVAELSRSSGTPAPRPREDRGFGEGGGRREDRPRMERGFRDGGFRDREPRQDRGFGGGRSFGRDHEPRQDRGFGGDRSFGRDREPKQDRNFGRDREPRQDRGFGRDREPRQDRFQDREPRQDRFQDREPKHKLEPVSITYTTAASQFIYGLSVVQAALRARRRKLYKLYVYNGAGRREDAVPDHILLLARHLGIPTEIVGGPDGLRLMNKMSNSRPHNGIILEASPLPQLPVTALGPLPEDYATNPGYAVTLAHQSAEEIAINGAPSFLPSPSTTHKPLVVVLDQVLDPGNLGAILRSVSFLGATAVGITRSGSATLTNVALKASAGASEGLTIFSINSLPEFLNGSRENGWVTYAAVAEGPKSGIKQRRHVDLGDVEEQDPLRNQPCVLIIGNEGEGLSRLVVKKADYEVNIPNLSGSTAVDSLNVSVAAGLLCSAFMRGMAKEERKKEAEATGVTLF